MCMTFESGHKRHCGFFLALSWISYSALQLPQCEDTQAAPCRGPWGKELRPPVNSHWVSHLGSGSSSPALDESSLSQQLACNLLTDPEPPNCPWTVDPQTLCEIINACCFRQISFEVICCAAMKNWYEGLGTLGLTPHATGDVIVNYSSTICRWE